MTDDLSAISFDRDYTNAEWSGIFDLILENLDNEDEWTQHTAFNKLKTALGNRLATDDAQFYLSRVFDQVEALFQQNPDRLAEFCSRFDPIYAENKNIAPLISDWLKQMAILHRPENESHAILAAQIFFGKCASSWQEWGDWLIANLEHRNVTVRACVASQIGAFYAAQFQYLSYGYYHGEDQVINPGRFVGMPPIVEVAHLIQTQEANQPGIAGPFWQQVGAAMRAAGVDDRSWLLDTLEQSVTPEPYIIYYSCNLAFYAHEIFADDPIAIRHLMNMGRTDIAIMAATDSPWQNDSLETILVELGNSDDDEIVRLASWHLAYYYHYLHPKGAELGFVELVDHCPEIDLFLMHNINDQDFPIYAAAIYAKKSHEKLSFELAQKWASQLLPETIRGTIEHHPISNNTQYYDRSYVEYHVHEQKQRLVRSKIDYVDCVIIGYRSSQPWNPKDYL